MMNWSEMKSKLPGIIALVLVTATTCMWVFWGVAEMFYEGWGLPFPEPLAYLIPGVACLLLSAAAARWPRFGGWLLILFGGVFTIWWIRLNLARGILTFVNLLTMLPLSGLLVLTGGLFLIEHRRRKRLPVDQPPDTRRWYVRRARMLTAVGIPLAVAIVTALFNIGIVMNRLDDGIRTARVIEGNGVTLEWAPEGPGWNWKQDFGGYPSWNAIALYGVEPVGIHPRLKFGMDSSNATQRHMDSTCLCAYLSEDGTTLMDEPQYVWRMPTTDEVVRSLCSNGENAGCTWDGTSHFSTCEVLPDKETPLWAPDQPPIYYWTADEYDSLEAWYVGYNGRGVSPQPKTFGNPRHGYRCVRELAVDTSSAIPKGDKEASTE